MIGASPKPMPYSLTLLLEFGIIIHMQKEAQLGFEGEFSKLSFANQSKTIKNLANNTTSREMLIKKNAWQKLDPTPRQIYSITQMCMALGINEPFEERVSNRREARDLMCDLRGKLKLANLDRKPKELK